VLFRSIARITAVDGFLSRQVDTGPGFLVDPSCKPLINALRGGYRYRRKTNGEVEDVPDKNQSSHIADSLQYLCLHANAEQGGALATRKARPVEMASIAGWT
jgi:hypothetical protein